MDTYRAYPARLGISEVSVQRMRASLDDLGDVGPLRIGDARGTSADDAIRALSEAALMDPILAVVLETINGYAMVIDGRRKILAANNELLDLLEVDERN